MKIYEGPLLWSRMRRVEFRKFIEDRNRLVIMARARPVSIWDSSKKSSWVIKLELIDETYPEFKGIGIYKLKG